MRIQSIQILRCFACLAVVLCHTTGVEFGQTGVDFFLIISGFVMMLSTSKPDSMNHFWHKRIKRIVPLYYGVTLFTSLLIIFAPQLFNSYEFSLEYLIKSLLFIPYYHNGVAGPIVALGWTLNYEMLFYVLFWVSSKINHKNRGVISGSLLIILVVLGQLLDFPLIVEYWTKPIILEFVLGIILYFIFQKYNSSNNSESIVVTCVLYFACALCMFLMEYIITTTSITRSLSVGLVAAVLIFVFVFYDKSLIKSNILLHVGKTSYEIYLLHPFFVRGFDMLICNIIKPGVFPSLISMILSVISIELLLWFYNTLVLKLKARWEKNESNE